MNGAPQPPAPAGAGWIDLASRAIVQVGFPVVAACVLLWFVLFRFVDQIGAIATRLDHNAEVAELPTQQNAAMLAELQRQTVAIEEIARTRRAHLHPAPAGVD